MTGWLLDPDIIYLNHGAFGALPEPVAAAASEIREMIELDPSDIFVRRLIKLGDDTRDRVAAFLGAVPANCVFVPNATAGTATVLNSLEWQPGDEIVTTNHKYGAVRVQANQIAKRYGVRIVTVDIPLEVEAADLVPLLTAAFNDHTKLLVIDAITSPSGMVWPIDPIVAAAHDKGVPVLVDAAHSPGQVHCDVQRTDADFWVGNLHKWVNSPRACAIMSVAPKWQDTIRPLIASFFFEDGYHDAFAVTGVYDPVPMLTIPAALDFWDNLGWDAVRQQQHRLALDGARVIAAALGTKIPVREELTASMQVIELPAGTPAAASDEISRRLAADHRIEVPVMALGDRALVRVTGQIYNTANDYERLARALPVVLNAVN